MKSGSVVCIDVFNASHRTAGYENNGKPGPGFAALPGTPLPIDTEVEVLAKQGLWWQVDVVGEVNGVMDIVGWSHSKYLEAVDG